MRAARRAFGRSSNSEDQAHGLAAQHASPALEAVPRPGESALKEGLERLRRPRWPPHNSTTTFS